MPQSLKVVIVTPSKCMADGFVERFRRTHPMSCGGMHVRRDAFDDFVSLRERTFGFDLAPLPRSLQLPPAENTPDHVLVNALSG